MAGLVCDICGGKLTIGAGGSANCQVCGVQYSAERIKEMARGIAQTGTVQKDSSNQTAGYMEMANSAINAQNMQEAELYSNKVLEIDPTNYEAWLIKGKAAMWQSSLTNSRVDEGIRYIAKGVNYAPADKKELRANYYGDVELFNVLKAMNSLRKERFEKWVDEEETNGWISDFGKYLDSISLYNQLVHPTKFDGQSIMDVVTLEMLPVVQKTWNQCQSEYIWPNMRPADAPDINRLNKYIEKSNYCIRLLRYAGVYCNYKEGKETIYNQLISICECVREAKYWKFDYISGGIYYPVREVPLAADSKATLTSIINDAKQKINEIKRTK